MTKALLGPRFEVPDGLGSLGAVELSALALSSDDSENLDVDDVGRGVVVVASQPVADHFSALSANDHLTEAGSVNHSIWPSAALLVERCQYLEAPGSRSRR